MAEEKDLFFGFKKVKYEDRQKLVNNVFDKVHSKYDIMNDLLSAGSHRLWKAKFVNLIMAENINTLVDVGGGTGDIAIKYIKNGGEQAHVVDINSNMISVGKDRAINLGITDKIQWHVQNGEDLSSIFKDNFASAYSIAFCIRNVSDINKLLVEAKRVLKPGGKFFCLEFSKVNPIISKPYDFFSFNLMPKIGELVAKDSESYKYLAESIRKFPPQEEFKNMIIEAGFADVHYINLSLGIAAIHVGTKL